MRLRFLAKKCGFYIGVLFTIITLNFFLIRAMPGDPLIHYIGEQEYFFLMTENPGELDILRAKFGIDKPVIVQYGNYLSSMLQLDFGYSYVNKQPLIDLIGFRLKWTLILVLPAVIISACLGALMGAVAGCRPGKLYDKIFTPFFQF